MHPREILVGRMLVGASGLTSARTNLHRQTMDDRAVLEFDTGRLHIENPFTLKCASNEAVVLSSIMGSHITGTIVTSDEIMIEFEGMIYLCISLREEDFIGPEAASFISNSGEKLFSLDSKG